MCAGAFIDNDFQVEIFWRMQQRRACDRCHRLKQVCDKQVPCGRCTRAEFECTYDRTPAVIGRPKSSDTKTKVPINKTRYSHNACTNCKKRKQKCDEMWPRCLTCKRLNLTCSGPIKVLKIKPHKATVITQPDSEQQANKDTFSVAQQDVANTGNFGDLLESLSPSMDVLLNQTSVNILDLTNELFNDETNFLNSKERLFLNSLVRSPTFPGEVIDREPMGAPSIPPTEMTLIRTVDETSPHSVLSSELEIYEEEKLNLLESCALRPYNIPLKQLELLKYFITDVSSLLFIDKTSTRFLKTVVPLAIEDSNVRYPIMGIAASHRSNSMDGANVEFKRDFAIYRAKSQSLFIANTIDYFQDTENVLLTILLLAIQEIFEGTSLYWGFALEKAAKIIGKRGGLKKVSKFAPLSVQLFCYLDLISSLSTCSSPYVDNSEFGDYDEDHIESILNNKFGFKFGIAGEIFKIIGNISTLASLRVLRYNSQENEKKFNSLATLIEMRLQNWSPSLDGRKYQIDNSVDDGKLMLSKFTVALQWSAFLRLHQIRNGYDRRDQRIEACLLLILSSMKEIQNNSDLETGLMFPLIMAGSVAYKSEDRDYILSTIRRIKERLKFSYIDEFERLLLLVWERDSDENHQVNWAKIRYFEYPGLVMF